MITVHKARLCIANLCRFRPIPARLWCAATRPLGYGSKWWNIVNCTGYKVFLASLHVGGGVCASGKLALADISTRSTSGPFSAGRAVVPSRDLVGSRGCFRFFFQSLWDWTGITAAVLSCCLSDFRAIRSTYTPDLAALGTPGIWRRSFLPRSWQGPNIIYWNTLHVIYVYIYIYIYIYIYKDLVTATFGVWFISVGATKMLARHFPVALLFEPQNYKPSTNTSRRNTFYDSELDWSK